MRQEKTTQGGDRTHQRGCMGDQDYRDCTCAHEPINQMAATVGLAQVRKSLDPEWQKWAVIYPIKPTEWFDTEEEAESVKRTFNGSNL